MDINEKMKLCFNDEMLNNKILTENEKKVLASLMYSYQICSKSHDNEIIRSMDAIRKDTQMSNSALYDAIRNLDSLYHMIERKAGKSRVNGQPSIGSTFKLNFDAILNPPKERIRFDFSKMKKSSETPINTVDIDTVIDADIDTNIGINTDIITDKDTDISKEVNIDINKDIITNKDIDIESNRDNEIEKDVVFENEKVNISNNSLINLDYYFPSGLQSYRVLEIKSQLEELINYIPKLDYNQILTHLSSIYQFITQHKDSLISWKIDELREKVQEVGGVRIREVLK